MLEQIFDCEKTPSAGQENWLRVIAHIPEIKSAFMSTVNEDDLAVAANAKEVLRKHNLPVVKTP